MTTPSSIASSNAWFVSDSILKAIKLSKPDTSDRSRDELVSYGDEVIDEIVRRATEAAKANLRTRLSEIFDLEPTDLEQWHRDQATARAREREARHAEGEIYPGELYYDGDIQFIME